MLSLCGDQSHVAVALVEPVAGRFRLVGWQMAAWSYPHPPDRIHEPYRQVCRQLGEQLGRPLWDEEAQRPYMEDPEPALGLHVGQVAVAAQPLPPLRVWMAALSELESLAALQEALSTALSQPVGHCTLEEERRPDALARALQETAPHVAIVAGGYDLPDASAQEPILELCDLVAQALSELPPTQRPWLFFAGNRWAAAEALDLWMSLPGGVHAEAVENILPRPGWRHPAPLTVALSRAYWRRCQDLPVLRTLADWATPPAQLRSFSWCFVQTVRLWREAQGLEELYGLYRGDARWLHVWEAGDEDGVHLRFTEPGGKPPADWPPLGLLSGRGLDPSLRAQARWIDPEGLAPAIGNLGQFDPEVARQVLTLDVLGSVDI
ncbi:MAG: hypothetical protein D6790_17055 [Caldilineae bacterium]|nr:MAG: hypothetical protein D6790_17055 [Caldilineae bacterium]